MQNIVKQKIRRGELTIGSWICLAHPTIAEIIAKSGPDWIVIDMEHTTITVADIEPLIQVIEANGVVPLVRLPDNDPILAKKVMDIGAYGVIVPMVNTVEEAQKAVASIKYPPQGIRGVGLYRAQEFGSSFDEYKDTANDQSIVIVQIEHKDGVENIEGITKVEGVDGVFIGPYDLSCSLGVSGELDHPLVQEARDKVVAQAKKAKIALGTHVVHPDIAEVKSRIKQGYDFISYSTDAIMLNKNFRSDFKELRK